MNGDQKKQSNFESLKKVINMYAQQYVGLNMYK